jgi:hypothetical protein
MANAYLGFYWALPVNWAGFRRLPANIDDAAAGSRTIRYQRERVRAYVAESRGRLVDEIAFIDMQPDRATDLVEGASCGRRLRPMPAAPRCSTCASRKHALAPQCLPARGCARDRP